jgi:predicted Zn-dependent peptidase
MRRVLCWLAVAALLGCGARRAEPGAPTPGRDAALALDFPALDFQPPQPELHTLPGGIEVLHLEDGTLPLVTVLARFEGGYGRFPRDYYAAGLALPTLLRSGGTRSLTPDSLDVLLERYALQTSFGSGGGSVTSNVNTLSEQLGRALEIWGEMLKEPRFDSARAEVWRGQELESVLRRRDDPGRLAVSQFNNLMYGDHPVGWEMSPDDLEPEDLSPEQLSWLHRRIVCPDNLLLGVTGDVSWDEIEPLLVELLRDWPPCEDALPPIPLPRIRQEGGVFLIPRPIEQSTVVLAHTSDVRQGDTREYFASRIGNAILGAGGFSSRLLTRLRTEEGYAYSASSLWTTPREAQGLVGALTQTRSGTTVAATRLLLEVFEEMRTSPPDPEEVRAAIDEAVNGFVFNFESPTQVVFRQMLYRAEGLPPEWLEAYLAGIQGLEPSDILDVFRRELRPDDMTILVVGNPAAFDEPLEVLGPVTVIDIGGGAPADGASAPSPPSTSSPSGAPRFRR